MVVRGDDLLPDILGQPVPLEQKRRFWTDICS